MSARTVLPAPARVTVARLLRMLSPAALFIHAIFCAAAAQPVDRAVSDSSSAAQVQTSPDTAAAATARPPRRTWSSVLFKAKPAASMALSRHPGGGSRWIKRNAVRILMLLLSGAIIWMSVLTVAARFEQKRFLTTTRLSIMDKEVQQVCRYIEKHFADPGMTPASVCESLETGLAFIQALFERELGMTVEDFIGQVRINRARTLLEEDPDISASDLASQTGLPDAASFCTLFNRVATVTLECYRTARKPA